MDLQRFAALESKENSLQEKFPQTVNKQIIEGLRFGIGLAFLSMALNGMTDHLLFNIPSSILMWQLGALSAAINLLPEEETTKHRRRHFK